MRAQQQVRDAEQKLANAVIAQRKAEIAQHRAEADRQAEMGRSDALRAQLMLMYSSTSWKFARPVRAVSKALRLLRSLVRRPPLAAPVEPEPERPPAPSIAPVIVLEAREQAILNRLLGGQKPPCV